VTRCVLELCRSELVRQMRQLIFQSRLEVVQTLVDKLRIDCACLRFMLPVFLHLCLKLLDLSLELLKLLVHVILSDIASGD